MSTYFGSNNDPYTGSGKIWEIAKRHNDKSKAINGHVTARRRRKVKQVERVGIL